MKLDNKIVSVIRYDKPNLYVGFKDRSFKIFKEVLSKDRKGD